MMEVVSKKLSELHEASKNVRKHTDKQIAEYVRSLDMFGQIKPIVVDETGEIIAGNGLYLALKSMGRETCDCYVISGLTSAQKKKLMLADNRVYELGITDTSVFEELVRELDGDIDVPGWDEDLLSMMNATIADVDDVVSSYGNFEESDINRISERKEQPAVQPAETPSVPSYTPAQVNTPPTPQNVTVGEETALQHRYIICPKCGEKICL